MIAILRACGLSLFLGALVVAYPSSAISQVCGARVTVRQIGMTPNEDGTRTARYRASVLTDQPTCAKVSFTIIRSYIKPDGAAFEDAIPVEVQVPGRAVDVEGETLANTRRLIYWRADKVNCQPCADQGSGVPSAPVPSAGSKPAKPSAPVAAGDSTSKMPKVGKKTALIAGGAAVAAGAVVVLGGGSSAAAAPGPDGTTPTPTPAPAATATAAPTPDPTPTPSGPKIFPGAPPAAPSNSINGDISLLNLDPPSGASIPASRGTVSARFQVFAERVGADMRLELQFWSGGEMCLRDVSAPLELRANQPLVTTMGVPNVRRCAAPFRTTLLRAYLNDGGTAMVVQDFPVTLDFMP